MVSELFFRVAAQTVNEVYDCILVEIYRILENLIYLIDADALLDQFSVCSHIL